MSHYKICPECGADITTVDGKPRPTRTSNNAAALNMPFACSVCGGLKITYRPTLDRVMVYPEPVPDTYVDGGNIVVPEPFKHLEEKTTGYGHVLAFGKGYYCSKRFHPIADLYVSAKVLYDKTVPWSLDVPGTDGVDHCIKIMGFQDIKVVLEDHAVV